MSLCRYVTNSRRGAVRMPIAVWSQSLVLVPISYRQLYVRRNWHQSTDLSLCSMAPAPARLHLPTCAEVRGKNSAHTCLLNNIHETKTPGEVVGEVVSEVDSYIILSPHIWGPGFQTLQLPWAA
jgi:hypothetical protein